MFQDERAFSNRREAGRELARLLPTRTASRRRRGARPSARGRACRVRDCARTWGAARRVSGPQARHSRPPRAGDGRDRIRRHQSAQRRGRPVRSTSRRILSTRSPQREQSELERRESAYRHGRPLPSLRNRTVILVDDGLATGSTMKAAVQAVKQQEPARVIVAVPVGAPETCRAASRNCGRGDLRAHARILLRGRGVVSRLLADDGRGSDRASSRVSQHHTAR